jgi:nucleotide-binding universal stress UspA family protein
LLPRLLLVQPSDLFV